METLLQYENQIYLDMFHNDALLITAEGLGIERMFLNFIKLYSDPTHLVLIINMHEAEEQFYIDRIKEMISAKKSQEDDQQQQLILPTKITTDTHSQNERAQVYLKGGCFFITSRILVVDMLTDRIPIDLITGILVYNAHKVIDSCQETFIMRMFRQKNKKGFIKAFSDNPVFFSRSSSKVDRIMKNLFVKNLYIYPRFHVDIESELTKYKPDLVEIHVSLSENSRRVLMALFDIINVLLQEFKSCCAYVDHDFLSMEMVISKPFDKIVKAQLEPVWNQLGSKPKQLLQDIKTLRLLIFYLTQYDCITFYRMLTCLKSHEKEMGRSSGWMFLDAANELFLKAKVRVFGSDARNLAKLDLKSKKIYYNKDLVKRIVTESPKLAALKEVLEEIGHDEENFNNEVNILIVANDDRTCAQIKHFLRHNHLTQKAQSFKNKKTSNAEKFDIVEDSNDADEEKEEEFLVKMILRPLNSGNPDDDMNSAQRALNFDRPSKKTFQKDKDTVTLTQMVKRKANTDHISDDEEKDSSSSESEEEGNKDSESSSSSDGGEDTAAPIEQSESTSATSSNKKRMNTNLFISAFEGGTKQKMSLIKLLYESKPRYIVLYDIQLWFVRQLEVFKTLNFQTPMRVYVLMYKNSSEEQRYLTSIRTEKESFEILIRQKASMIIHEEQDGKQDFEKEPKQTIAAQVSSRAGGMVAERPAEEERPVVIVDMREFRSELPSLLHKRGIHIEPCTLEVGDYVLTPSICVERKSINDLIESLSNGRLYNQANAMSRSYKTPVLMIEFDANKPFVLNSRQYLASRETGRSEQTSSKLVLLTLHFPKLRILWCSSPSEAAEIFEEIKENSPQPDAKTAMAVKSDQITEDQDAPYNPVLSDLLLKIPGINSKNVIRVMSKVKNMYELCQMSEEQLSEVLENSKAAKQVYEFFNKSIKDDSLGDEFNFEDLKNFYSGTKNKKGPASSSDLTSAASTSTSNSKNIIKMKSKSSSFKGPASKKMRKNN